MSNKYDNKRKLKEIVATNKIYSKEMLLDKLNSKLGENTISMSTLSNYISECKISIDKQKKYYTFTNQHDLPKVKAKILNDWIKKHKLKINEPMILATSIINANNSLYLLAVSCTLNYEKVIANKLSKYITPDSYHINSKSIFFYFSNEKSVKEAYDILK